MGWSYRKSKKIGPFRVTASKKGLSYSVGGKGFRVTKRADGKTQVSTSVGGLRYTETIGSGKKQEKRELTQYEKDIYAAKLPLVGLIASILLISNALLFKNVSLSIISIISIVLTTYLYLFSKSVQSATYLKDAEKYARKNDNINVLKCAKLSNKYKENETAKNIINSYNNKNTVNTDLKDSE